MSDFNTTLLREKFVIHDALASHKKVGPRQDVTALSNRIVLPLVSRNGEISETIIVRAQNMHTCARMAARIVQDFQDKGPILNRPTPFDWRYAWLSITKGFEDKFNPHRWVAVYHKGQVIYKAGEEPHHPFLDIIEQCDARNRDNYEKAVTVAEDAFKQAGKIVTIEHDSNIALIITAEEEEVRCGVIVRGPNRTTTFNFTAKPRAGRPAKVSQCLSAAAAFLEGIQLSFQVGLVKQKLLYELILSGSPEAERSREATLKIGRLNGAIQQFENLADVSYRPERPDFGEMMDSAQQFAKAALASELERRIETGENGSDSWIT